MSASRVYSLPLQARVTCPHCWHGFSPEETLWVSRHPELVGDLRLGAEQQQRFLPTRFSIEGDALDAEGFTCNSIACPKCHLNLPRAMLEMPPLFCSILGAPGSGKSYFLAAMTWALRQKLPQHFRLSLADVEPTAHINLNAYEETLFLNGRPDELVALPKTDLQGDHLYDTVLYGEQHVIYPRPFVFALRPLSGHPLEKRGDLVSRALCLYDNAGEHFLPGSDKVGTPVTQHLASSRFLFFLFDPTQDPRFRDEALGRSADPQMSTATKTFRQETILLEAADRVRRYAGVAQTGKHQKPLIVVVTKFDAWCSLIGQEPQSPQLPSPYGNTATGPALDLAKIEDVSRAVRLVLNEFSREFVAAAESFAEHVIYVPVSALGRGPEIDPRTGALCVRPREIQSLWVEMPLMYALGRWSGGLIPAVKPRATSASAPSAVAVG